MKTSAAHKAAEVLLSSYYRKHRAGKTSCPRSYFSDEMRDILSPHHAVTAVPVVASRTIPQKRSCGASGGSRRWRGRTVARAS